MASYKTAGIILKTRKLGEADRIIILLTATRGRVEAVAKGIRRTKSKFGARLEPFSEANLFLHEGRNLDIITQVELLKSNQNIREDLTKLTYGWAILNLVEMMLTHGQSESRSYILLRKSLHLIDQNKISPEVGLLVFSLKLADLQGYQPDFSNCTECRKPYRKGIAHFSYSRGGLVCSKCLKSQSTDTKISEDGLQFLKRTLILSNDLSDFDNLPNLSEKKVLSLLQIFHRYLEYHFHMKLKSWDFIITDI